MPKPMNVRAGKSISCDNSFISSLFLGIRSAVSELMKVSDNSA